MRDINLIIIHCSDSDIKSHDNPETIRKWHVEERGFNDIGYHYVITKDGKRWPGRREAVPGAHARGHNANSLGICLTGRKKFSEKQRNSLKVLVNKLLVKYPGSKVIGHCEVSDKTCPNFDYKKVLKDYID